MCKECWIEEGRPRALPEGSAEIITLIRDLYNQPDGGTGGPLHVLLDDFNLEHVEPWLDTDWLPATVELAVRIADRMRDLTEPQRGAVIAEWEGWIIPRPPAHCTHGAPRHTEPEPVTCRITWPGEPDAVGWACATHADKIVTYQASRGITVEVHPVDSSASVADS